MLHDSAQQSQALFPKALRYEPVKLSLPFVHVASLKSQDVLFRKDTGHVINFSMYICRKCKYLAKIGRVVQTVKSW
jgi:hypothetical protein